MIDTRRYNFLTVKAGTGCSIAKESVFAYTVPIHTLHMVVIARHLAVTVRLATKLAVQVWKKITTKIASLEAK